MGVVLAHHGEPVGPGWLQWEDVEGAVVGQELGDHVGLGGVAGWAVHQVTSGHSRSKE